MVEPKTNTMKQLAIFASGNGSNAINIIEFFRNNTQVNINFVLSNKHDAGVIALAESKNIEVVILSNSEIENSQKLLNLCVERAIDGIILAGFLRKLPLNIISFYQKKIVNIHPSLLPKYGGKGMYGDRVHKAVLENKEKFSGISIHYVDTNFDTGELIAQFYCKIDENENVETLRKKIHRIEHAYYPCVIKQTFLI